MILLLDSDVDELQLQSEKESDNSAGDDTKGKRGGDDQCDLEMSCVCHLLSGHKGPYSKAMVQHK